MPGEVRFGDPFVPPAGRRSPARRLRGRLASPVTVWTSSGEEGPVGLTISSLIVAEGEPSRVAGLVGPDGDLHEAIERSGGFVIHVLGAGEVGLADRFAGLRPSPGGQFAGLRWDRGERGPVLSDLPVRAHCRLERIDPVGFQDLVIGEIELVEPGALDDPAVFFRGRHRRLRPN